MFLSDQLKYLSCGLLLSAMSVGLQAQTLERELVSSNGGTATSTNLLLEWSIGEVVVGDLSYEDWKITQGLHQGVQEIIDRVNTPVFNYQIELFPNPSSDKVYLKREQIEDGVFIEIYNELGQQIVLQQWVGYQQEIDVSSCVNGLYFVIVRGLENSTVFKLIKEQ